MVPWLSSIGQTLLSSTAVCASTSCGQTTSWWQGAWRLPMVCRERLKMGVRFIHYLSVYHLCLETYQCWVLPAGLRYGVQRTSRDGSEIYTLSVYCLLLWQHLNAERCGVNTMYGVQRTSKDEWDLYIICLFIISLSGNILMLSAVGSRLCMVCREHQKMSLIYMSTVFYFGAERKSLGILK